MDAAIEFVEVGGKIMTLSGQLAPLKAERDALNEQITALERELVVLAGRYSELIAATLGTAMPKPAVPVVAPVLPGPAGPTPNDEKLALIRRVKGFLNNAEPGTSAMQIADALKVDASLVREVMREMVTS